MKLEYLIGAPVATTATLMGFNELYNALPIREQEVFEIPLYAVSLFAVTVCIRGFFRGFEKR